MVARPRPPRAAARAVLLCLAALLGGCWEEVIPGRCQSTSDCQLGQRCEVDGGANFHRCVALDGGTDGPGEAGVIDGGVDRPEVADTRPDVLIICATNASCTDPDRPFCQGGRCVECDSPDAGTCPMGQMCDRGRGACVECLEHGQCANPDLPLCVAGKCTGCGPGGGDPACKAREAGKPVCLASGRCGECATNEQCKTDPGRPLCTAGTCAGCQSSPAVCTGATPSCNSTNGACVECVADADCKTATAPVCEQNRCVACGSAPANRCAQRMSSRPACAPSGECVECNSSADCSFDPMRPVCNTTERTCRPCTRDSECAERGPSDPGICLDHLGGRCATEAESIFVSPMVVGCAPTMGTRMTPLCTAQDAYKLVTPARSVVILRGTLPGFTWMLAAPPPLVTVVGKDGAVVAGGVNAGIVLEGPGEVLLRNLTVRGSEGVGITARGGATIKLRELTVARNSGGGILIDGAKFDIRATEILENGPGQTGAIAWGGMLALAVPGTPASLENVSIRNNSQVGVSCASAITGIGVHAKNNVGGIDVQATCMVTTCEPESPTCGWVRK